mgnify:CR=1 FL=1
MILVKTDYHSYHCWLRFSPAGYTMNFNFLISIVSTDTTNFLFGINKTFIAMNIIRTCLENPCIIRRDGDQGRQPSNCNAHNIASKSSFQHLLLSCCNV